MLLLRKAYQLCEGQFRYLLSFTGVLIPGILAPMAGHATVRPWEIFLPGPFLLTPGPTTERLSVAALVCGGLILTFAKKESTRTLGGILFGLGMARGAINITSMF